VKRTLISVVHLTPQTHPKLWRFSLRGEILICLRWWFDTKELCRVVVKS